MKNIKIYKKSLVMKNVALFAFFSLFYLHVIQSFVSGVSTFNMEILESYILKNKILLGSFLFFCITLFGGKKYARLVYVAFISQCVWNSFEQYFVNQDKFVLILNFFYLILAYYFYLFMNADLEEAAATPVVSSGDLYTGLSVDSVVDIKVGEVCFKGRFVNWDQSTCFIKIDNLKTKIKGKIQLDWKFENNEYSCLGRVVTGVAELGVGVRVMEEQDGSSEGLFGWTQFYDILQARGYRPQLTA